MKRLTTVEMLNALHDADAKLSAVFDEMLARDKEQSTTGFKEISFELLHGIVTTERVTRLLTERYERGMIE